MRICSVETFKNATSGRARELLDSSWIYKERDDSFNMYNPHEIWYLYCVFCPDELLAELYRYGNELDDLANKINQKVLARSSNLKVMVSITPKFVLFSKCEYNRQFLNIYLEEMKERALKTENTDLTLPPIEKLRE